MKKHAPILLAEDDENDVFFVQVAFKQVGLLNPLMVVRDGVDAIHYLAGEGIYANRKEFPRPYLVLLDLKMPQKGGLDVLDWLQAHPGTHKLVKVILSSSDDPTDMARAKALGVNVYTPKPIGPSGMSACLRDLRARWLTPGRRPCPARPVEKAIGN